ncbi:hypothetical protein [Chitiniphilus shinanonensis]|nr:hypothetical protein [Chitiniphilus shinanonensis]
MALTAARPPGRGVRRAAAPVVQVALVMQRDSPSNRAAGFLR